MTGRPVNSERRRERQDAFLAAFEQTGILKQAAELSGVVASQHSTWLNNDQDYAARFTEAKANVAGIAATNRRPHSRGYKQGGQRGANKARNQEKFLEVLARIGILADAAAEAGIVIGTYHYWRRSDPEFAALVEAAIAATEQQRTQAMSERRSQGSKAAWEDQGRRDEWARRQREEFWTPERRTQQAQRMAEYAATPEGRAMRVESGQRQWTVEKRQDRAEEMREMWTDPQYRESMAEKMEHSGNRTLSGAAARERWAAMSVEDRKAHMRKARSVFKGGHRLTKIEAAVLVALNDREIPYFVHKYIDGYVADVLVPSLRLVVECDGAYHHGRRKGTDEVRDAALLALGYETLRLSEAEITAKDWARLDEAIARLT